MMIVGIISIVIGAIVFIYHLFIISADTVAQQTVQYLGYILAALFLIGGNVLFILGSHFKKEPKTPEEMKECPKCGEKNKLDATECWYCKRKFPESNNDIKAGEQEEPK